LKDDLPVQDEESEDWRLWKSPYAPETELTQCFTDGSDTDLLTSNDSLLSEAKSLASSEKDEQSSPIHECPIDVDSKPTHLISDRKDLRNNVESEEDEVYDWRDFLSPDLPRQSISKRRAGALVLMLPTPSPIETTPLSDETSFLPEDNSEMKIEEVSGGLNSNEQCAFMADQPRRRTLPVCPTEFGDTERSDINEASPVTGPEMSYTDQDVVDGEISRADAELEEDDIFDWRDALSPDLPRQNIGKRRTGASVLILPRPSPLENTPLPDEASTFSEANSEMSTEEISSSPKGSKKYGFVIDRRRRHKLSVGLIDDDAENADINQASYTAESLTTSEVQQPIISTDQDLAGGEMLDMVEGEEQGDDNDLDSLMEIESTRSSPDSRIQTRRSGRRESLFLLPNALANPWQEEKPAEKTLEDSNPGSTMQARPSTSLEDEDKQQDRHRSCRDNFVSTRQASPRSYESANEDEANFEVQTTSEMFDETLGDAFEESCMIPESVVRVGEKVVLEAIYEELVTVDNSQATPQKNCGYSIENKDSEIDELRWQVKNLLIEKKKLADRLYSMRKGYENRITPFRDVFEEVSHLLV
jgi:hypothetical protein